MGSVVRFPSQNGDPRDLLQSALDAEDTTGVIILRMKRAGTIDLEWASVKHADVYAAAHLLSRAAQNLAAGEDDEVPEGAAV